MDEETKKALEELTNSVREKMKEMQAVKDKMDGEVAENGKYRDETKGRLETIIKDVASVNAKILDLQQKAARPSGEQLPQSMGMQFVNSEAFKAYNLAQGSRLVIDVRNDITSANTSAGALIAPDRRDLLITPPDRVLRVRSLCMPGSTESNLVQYQREDVFTNNANTIAEAGQYPQSEIKYKDADAKVKKIGHFIKVTKEVLDDSPQLQSLIDGRLKYGVLYKDDLQLLLGDGTSNNILGIVPQSSAYDADRTLAGDTMADILSHAITQSISDEYYASGIVLNPQDWEKIRLLKTTDGAYIFAGPMQSVVPTLWGLPVVLTNAMPVNTFLTGAFAIGAQIFDRQTVEVEISTENGTDFEKDLITMKASERLALAVYRPAAFVTGTFPSAPESNP